MGRFLECACSAFEQRVACFHLISEARLIRDIRYHRMYFWTLFAYQTRFREPVTQFPKSSS
jgi:hypothetical protein